MCGDEWSCRVSTQQRPSPQLGRRQETRLCTQSELKPASEWQNHTLYVAVGFDVTLTTIFTARLTALAIAAVLLTVANIFHLAVAIGAPGPVAVATVIVALAAIILARRAASVTAGGGATTTRRAATTISALATVAAVATVGALAAGAVTAGVESPGSRGRGAGPLKRISDCVLGEERDTRLDLEEVVAADALVVHLVISVIGISAALVFHEGEAADLLNQTSFQWAR